MRSVLGIILVAGVLGVAGAWLADHPGELRLVWQGWELRSSVGALLLGIGILIALVVILQRAWLWLQHGPGRLVAGRRSGRRDRGFGIVGQGLVAVAAGDAPAARRLARRAQADLGEAPLTLLLEAQSAQLAGDEGAAQAAYQRMLEKPETELFALRSLATQAGKAGDTEHALEIARRARNLRPDAPWALVAVADLALQAGRWAEAGPALADAVRHKALGRSDGDRRRAVARLAEAQTEHQAGRRAEALAHARDAHKLAPGLVPATALLADLLREDGKAKEAARAIADTWRLGPHPDLARASAAGTTDPLERLRIIERLALTHADHPETRLAVAAAAIAAGLWGEARRQLAPLLLDAPGARACRLMAEIEEREKGAAGEARGWLVRVAEAPAATAWTCAACGAAAPAWTPLCPACGAFDGLAWRAPGRGRGALSDPARRP